MTQLFRVLLVVTFCATWFLIGVKGQELVGYFSRIVIGGLPGAGTVNIRSGTGSPESAVTGTVGDIFLRTDGGSGTTAYIKESGSSTTGWVAVSSGGGAGAAKVRTGSGSPVSAVTGNVGDIYLRDNCVSPGTCLYVKESGNGTNTGWVPTTMPASTTTLTEKTLDAEGSGNLITIPLVEYYPGAICQNTTASTAWNLPTSNPAVAACETGTNTQKGTLDFADGANTLSAQFEKRLPNDFSGTVEATVTWFTSATTGNVVWQVATACTSGGQTTDPTFNTASTVTDAAEGTTNRYNIATISPVTKTSCSAGSEMWLRLSRDPTNGSDTLAATARALGLELTYRRAM